MEISEASPSTIKRVVVKDATPQDKRMLKEEMHDVMKKGGEPFPNEIKKTPEQTEVINLVNKASDDVLTSLGLPAFPVPNENIHVVNEFDSEDGSLSDVGGTFYADKQLAIVAEGRNLLEFADFVTHELLHFKSYGVMQLASDQETLDFAYRGGFNAHSRDAQQPFFRTVDEALTELVTKRVIEDLKKQNPSILSQEIKDSESASQPIPQQERDKFLFVESLPADHPMRQEGRTVEAREFAYPAERASLDTLIEKLYESNPSQFSSKEDVLNLFLKGKFQGNFLQVGKLIDSTYGKGTFRNLGIISQSPEGFRLFVDALPSDNKDVESQNQRPLYRGLWVDTIKDGDQIPVGGSIFTDTLDGSILDVDTTWMEGKIDTFTRQRVDDAFNSGNGEKFKKLVEESGIKLDPETLHVLFQVQAKMRALLSVSDEPVARERKDLYLSKKSAKLSEFIGRSECAEQAVVGKILLDKIGTKASLIEGVHVDGKDQEPNDHAFLILDDTQGQGSLIFDIARPKASLNGYPRILRTDRKLDYSTFEGQSNYVVPAVDIYNGTTLYYGVGHSSLMQDVNFAD